MKLRCVSRKMGSYIFMAGGVYNVTHVEGRGTLYEVIDNFGTSRVISADRLIYPANAKDEVLATFEVVDE